VDADLAPELDDAPYLVMDLLKGADLATVSRGGPQAPAQVVEWLRQAACGLDAAHRCGIVHRDVKPENLFLTESASGEGLVKVLDFGIASAPAVGDTRDTKTGSLLGTPMFMAPEQASGGQVTPQADVWSLAMCAFRLLGGRSYWNAENATLLLAQIIYEQVLPPSVKGVDLGPGFDEWFLRSCARAPAERWPTAGVQIEALAAAVGSPVKELKVPERREPSPLLATHDTTLGELAASDVRSHSLAETYSSTSLPPKFRFGSLGVFFGFAALAAAVLSVQRPAAPPRSSADQRIPGARVPRPAAAPARAPSAPAVEPDRAPAPVPADQTLGKPAIPTPPRASVQRTSKLPANKRALPPSVDDTKPEERRDEPTALGPREPARGASSPTPSTPRDPLADPD
jgi:serine/threonine protein kinase